MSRQSLLRKHHESWAQANADRHPVLDAQARPGAATGHRLATAMEFIAYGPPGPRAVEIPATFGSVEAEYAALRRGAGFMDSAHRGTLRVRGADRVGFLNRMVTQELADVVDGSARASFWLNRKGRIDADLLIVELGDEMLIDVDGHLAAATVEALNAFVFSEDVTIEDASAELHRISGHGPEVQTLLGTSLDAGHAERREIGGVSIAVARRDEIGAPGVEMFVPAGDAEHVWVTLLGADVSGEHRVRPVGWYAYNIARIESGTPLFNIDFGPTNLPHESGALAQRVSFKKGCYLGQEVVARLESLGRPKQVLVGLRVQGPGLPVAGEAAWAAPEAPAAENAGDSDAGKAAEPKEVGVITSSTLSPMLGGVPIAFAMIRTKAANEGATVLVNAEGEMTPAVIGPLRMWNPEGR